jgi:hypothetical protein
MAYPIFTLFDPPTLTWAQESLSPCLFTGIPLHFTVELPLPVVHTPAAWGGPSGCPVPFDPSTDSNSLLQNTLDWSTIIIVYV